MRQAGTGAGKYFPVRLGRITASVHRVFVSTGPPTNKGMGKLRMYPVYWFERDFNQEAALMTLVVAATER